MARPRGIRAGLAPVHPRVLMIVHDPPIDHAGGVRLHRYMGWHDADTLAQQYIDDLAHASAGYCQYRITERIDAAWFPVKLDGFRYTARSYLDGWRSRRMHQPDRIDYQAQLAAFDLVARQRRGEFDEVWFFSVPYAGDYESLMVGRDAFWCNAPPLLHPAVERRFVMMMFNVERDVGCMLENFGHRAESIMAHQMRHLPAERDLWRRFTRYDLVAPGQAQCGNVHFAPNSQTDYDWGRHDRVWSGCDDWLEFPELRGTRREVDCAEWGGGDMRLHHCWWLGRLPCVPGERDGVSHNWWEAIIDPNRCA